METQVATSRVNLTALAVALIAGLIILQDTQGLFASLAGFTLLVSLLAYGRGGERTGMQSLALALVCGVALLCTCLYGAEALLALVGLKLTFLGPQSPQILIWVVSTAIFCVSDRPRTAATQPVSLSGYTQPISVAPATPTAAPSPVRETRPFTPAPVVVSVPEPEAQREVESAFTAAPDSPASVSVPPTAPPASTANVPVAPVRSGKEVNIYVTMLGEGMNVLRSVRAEHLGRDFYIIVDEMPADENWEFVPGQVVRCKKKSLSNGKGLVAYEEAPRAQ